MTNHPFGTITFKYFSKTLYAPTKSGNEHGTKSSCKSLSRYPRKVSTTAICYESGNTSSSSIFKPIITSKYRD